MRESPFALATPLAPVSTSTTRAKISATDVGACQIILSLDTAANARHFIGDSTVVAAGSAGVIAQLAAGQWIVLPVASTAGLYVVTFTGGSASTLYVAVLR